MKYITALLLAALSYSGCSYYYNPTADQQLGVWQGISPQTASAKNLETPRHFNNVLIIVMENTEKESAAEAIKGAFPALPDGVLWASFDDFHGLFHPSYSNYLAMVSGRRIESYFDIQQDFNFPTIADRFEEAGLDWRNYAEGYPGSGQNCFKGSSAPGHYARKHVPFLSFTTVTEALCKKHIVPIKSVFFDNYEKDVAVSAVQFLDDWNKARPAYSFYSPNLLHDGHDSPIGSAALWLKGFVEQLGGPDTNGTKSTFWDNTLVVVTFDESKGKEKTNRIYTALFGRMLKGGKDDSIKGSYNHFNILRTIEDNFGLAPIGDMDEKAKPVTDIWSKDVN